MASEIKNLLPLGGNWLLEVIEEDPVSIETFLHNGDDEINENNHGFKLPKVIGILPIRNAVAYPGTITPLAIGRKRSKALLADTTPNESIIGLLTQRNPNTDNPNFEKLYSIGTAASVLKVIKLPQGSMHVVVHGISRFKVIKKITTKPYLKAKIQPLDVKVKMTNPLDLKIDYTIELKNSSLSISSVNTGVPHVVIVKDSIDTSEVVKVGREIRFHPRFAPAGTNVNFVCHLKDNIIAIRTYERGVEDETLACGTGAIASAIVMSCKKKLTSPVTVQTRSGGCLNIFYQEKDGKYHDIYLEGDARIIYKAQLWEDALKDD